MFTGKVRAQLAVTGTQPSVLYGHSQVIDYQMISHFRISVVSLVQLPVGCGASPAWPGVKTKQN